MTKVEKLKEKISKLDTEINVRSKIIDQLQTLLSKVEVEQDNAQAKLDIAVQDLHEREDKLIKLDEESR